MKDSGVYLAVLILLRVNCCAGLPSSSRRFCGKGRLKYSCRGPGPCLCSCSSSSSWSEPSSWFCGEDRSVSEPPERRFFSDVTDFLFCLPINDRRFIPLLLTVIFLVAHLDLFVLSILLLSGLLLSLLVALSPVSLGVAGVGVIARLWRARPDQTSNARQFGPRRRPYCVRRPLVRARVVCVV